MNLRASMPTARPADSPTINPHWRRVFAFEK